MSRLTNPDWIAPHRARAYYFERNFPKNEEQCAFYNKLKEYENIGTIEDFKNLIKEAQIMLKNNEKHKQSIKELSDSNSKFYKENAELKQQLAEQVKTVNVERIETFDNRKRR